MFFVSILGPLILGNYQIPNAQLYTPYSRAGVWFLFGIVVALCKGSLVYTPVRNYIGGSG